MIKFGFHFLSLTPYRGFLSDPPVIIHRQHSSHWIQNLYVDKDVFGISLYDGKNNIGFTTIWKDKGSVFHKKWDNSPVFETQSSSYARVDKMGGVFFFQPSTLKCDSHIIEMEQKDFLTSAGFSQSIGVAVSFHNQVYFFNQTRSVHLEGLIRQDFLFARSIRLYQKNHDGPLLMVIQFQKGGLLFFKFLVYQELERCQVLESAIIRVEQYDFTNVLFLNNKLLLLWDQEQYKMVVWGIEDGMVKHTFSLTDKFIDIVVNTKQQIWGFDPQSQRWVRIRFVDST